MTNTLKALILFAAATSATGSALAQTHHPMTSSQNTPAARAMNAEQMMSQCEQMMKAMRSDPVLMKRMNEIMQKHMTHGMMNGGSGVNGGMMNSPHPSATPHS